jgi:hypothetical protein
VGDLLDPVSILDEFRLEVQPGDDLVARFPGGALLLMRTPLSRQRSVADQIVELCQAQPHGADDGRHLMRRVARILVEAQPDDVPAFALLTPTGERLATLVHGDAHVVVVVRGSVEQRLFGAESPTWVDRVFDPGFDRLEAWIQNPVQPSGLFELDLRAGAVPGSGWALARRGHEAPVAAFPHNDAAGSVSDRVSSSVPQRRQRTEVAPAGGTAVTQTPPSAAAPARASHPASSAAQPEAEHEEAAAPEPAAFESILLVDGGPPSEETRAALPMSTPDHADEVSGSEAPQVGGILCAKGHFNDPAALYCRIDGLSLAQRTHSYVSLPRPPLGVLVFDDGSSYSVDGDYVLGREPELDENVRAGRVRPLVVKDEEDAVSRVHAEIRIEGWSVQILDRGSANGTYVTPPGANVSTPLVPQQLAHLAPGTHVHIGGRTFVFDSHFKL